MGEPVGDGVGVAVVVVVGAVCVVGVGIGDKVGVESLLDVVEEVVVGLAGLMLGPCADVAAFRKHNELAILTQLPASLSYR